MPGIDEIAGVARVAEHSGFAYVAVCDHVAVPKDRAHDLTTVGATASPPCRTWRR